MSLFSYNGVQLPLPVSMKFNRTAVYEESNTDWYCTRFDIEIQCYLNVSYLQVIITEGGDPLETPSAIMNALWTILMTPRKKLSYVVEGVEMIPEPQIH
ncbi:MAG: hypothetical protein KGL95_07815 [Patescibacteria group bacterium]|nr:hypothetical protein [Patescibacteria group bacterium]